jgi:hypothetical protein
MSTTNEGAMRLVQGFFGGEGEKNATQVVMFEEFSLSEVTIFRL